MSQMPEKPPAPSRGAGRGGGFGRNPFMGGDIWALLQRILGGGSPYGGKFSRPGVQFGGMFGGGIPGRGGLGENPFPPQGGSPYGGRFENPGKWGPVRTGVTPGQPESQPPQQWRPRGPEEPLA